MAGFESETGEDYVCKTDTEVIIGGKVLTVSGNESAEYLQRVAAYINNKLNEYNKWIVLNASRWTSRIC